MLIRRPKIWPSETPCHWKRLFREHIIQPDQTGKLEWSMSTDVVDDRWMFFDVSFSLGGLYLLYPPLCAALLCLCWFHRTHSLPACLVCHFLLPATCPTDLFCLSSYPCNMWWSGLRFPVKIPIYSCLEGWFFRGHAWQLCCRNLILFTSHHSGQSGKPEPSHSTTTIIRFETWHSR